MITSDYQRDFQCHFVKMAHTAAIPTNYQLIIDHNTITNRSVTSWQLIMEQVSIYWHFIILVIYYMANFAKIMVCNWYFNTKVQKLNNDIYIGFIFIYIRCMYITYNSYTSNCYTTTYYTNICCYISLTCHCYKSMVCCYGNLYEQFPGIIIKLWCVVYGNLHGQCTKL